MLTDSWGQGVQYPTLEDKPNARALAEGLVNGIVPKSVLSFDSAAQRNATVTSPQAGMVSFLRDIKRWEGFDGTNWVAIAAGTSVWTNLSLVSPWLHDGNDNGNAQYRIVDLFGEKTIMFRGSFYRSSYPSSVPSSFVVTSSPLPVTSIIENKRTISIPVSDSGSTRITLKLDIQTDGHLSVWGFGSKDKPAWIGLNGVFCSL